MSQIVLIDTGPVVALLCRQEKHHVWVLEHLARLAPPLLTCEAVLAEADHLIRRTGRSGGLVIELVNRGVLAIGLDVEREARSISKLQTKYRDQSASLADACLVRMTEIHGSSRVMTFDGDFRIYRRHGRQSIPVLAPAT